MRRVFTDLRTAARSPSAWANLTDSRTDLMGRPETQGTVVFAEVDDATDTAEVARASGGSDRIVLVDRSAHPQLAVSLRDLPITAAITSEAAVAATYRLLGVRSVWCASDAPPGLAPIRNVVVATGRHPSDDEELAAELFARSEHPVVVTGARADQLVERLRAAGAVASVNPHAPIDVIAAEPSSLVVITAGSELVPDLALVMGHRVASSRAPIWADWRTVATVVSRRFGSWTSVGLRDVLDDPPLLDWVTRAALGRVCASVRTSDVPAAMLDAIEQIDREWIASCRLSSGYWEHLSPAGLAMHLARVEGAPVAG